MIAYGHETANGKLVQSERGSGISNERCVMVERMSW